jgi:hypothetical protein
LKTELELGPDFEKAEAREPNQNWLRKLKSGTRGSF